MSLRVCLFSCKKRTQFVACVLSVSIICKEGLFIGPQVGMQACIIRLNPSRCWTGDPSRVNAQSCALLVHLLEMTQGPLPRQQGGLSRPPALLRQTLLAVEIGLNFNKSQVAGITPHGRLRDKYCKILFIFLVRETQIYRNIHQ